MFLQFDHTIINFDRLSVRQGRALEILLGAFQANQHVIFVDMGDLRKLREKANDVVSASSKTAMTSLMHRSVEYQALVDFLDYKIVVYIEDDYKKGVVRIKNTWHVPLEFFSNKGLLESAILGENDLDAEIFIHFARIYQQIKNLNAFILAGRPRSGGGSGTPRVLSNYLRHEQSPCICITDSDKLHPKYKSSATSRHCKRISGVRDRVIEYISLEEREIENIIPIDLIKKVVNAEDFIRDFNNHVTGGDDVFWKYIDVKEGISLKWFDKKDEPTLKYWSKASGYLSRRSRDCWYCKNADEDELTGETCGCSTIDGLGDRVLEKVVGYMNETEPRLTARLFNSDLRWMDIGKIVFEFSLAPRGEMLLNI